MYVIVLAKTPQEGNTYAKRAKLPKGGYRVATRASAIRGLRVAEIHELPSFSQRTDRFAIDAVLRYTRGTRKKVEMPEPDLRIHDVEEAEEAAYAEDDMRAAHARAAVDAEAFVAALTQGEADMTAGLKTFLEDEIVSSEQIDREMEAARGAKARATEPSEDAAPAPKAKPTAPKRKPKAKQPAPTSTQGFF